MAGTSPPKIAITHLAKSFGAHVVLKDVSLAVPAGGVVALIGPSGSGKSTLLRCINLLVVPDSGEVRVGADAFRFGPGTRLPGTKALARFRANTGMVFQHFNLFPHLTALQNVMEGPVTVQRLPRPEAEARARALLAKVGLADKAEQYPSRLSGGQKQRVAIARALANGPRLLLADEPTGNLDPQTAGHVFAILVSLVRASGVAALIATHNLELAGRMDRRVTIQNGLIVQLA